MMDRVEKNTVLEGANAMPAPTWHYLQMNDVSIEVPASLRVEPAVATAVSDEAVAPAGTFEYSLAMLQSWWDARWPLRAPADVMRPAESDAAYGGTAQSAYQRNADALEVSQSLEAAFATGVGADTASLLAQAAGEPVVIASDEGQHVRATVTVLGVPGAFSAAAIDVVAGMNSTVDLDIVVDSPDAPENAAGFTGTTMRVLAGFGSKVNIRRMQTLDTGFDDIDDLGILTTDGARITVSQTVLGGNRTFTGLAADLRGDKSRLDIDLHYLGHGEQVHDFNYVVRHHGHETECDIQANGVLAGKSRKTLRGTIDLIRGCKGAQGNERETVLLVDKGVQNRTVPVILCNEDDVAGNHGATIGHVNAEQLHYLRTRGLSEKQAEALFLESSFDYALDKAPTEQAAAGVDRLAREVLGRSVVLDEAEPAEGSR